MYEWINLGLFILSLLLFSVLYFFSLMPMTLSERWGERSWKDCRNLRLAASFFEIVAVVTPILWIWFPIPGLAWEIFPNWWIGIIVGIVIIVPGAVLMYKGVKDAGKETLTPSKESEMYGGIYMYIRHPQSIGELPMFPALALCLNSWFLFIIMTAFILIYMPIMLIFEERDLVKRFGEPFKEYQKTTGAYFPKLSVVKSCFQRKKRNK